MIGAILLPSIVCKKTEFESQNGTFGVAPEMCESNGIPCTHVFTFHRNPQCLNICVKENFFVLTHRKTLDISVLRENIRSNFDNEYVGYDVMQWDITNLTQVHIGTFSHEKQLIFVERQFSNVANCNECNMTIGYQMRKGSSELTPGWPRVQCKLHVNVTRYIPKILECTLDNRKYFVIPPVPPNY